jgi:chemotaxis family two-component system sensor kinase Cph1
VTQAAPAFGTANLSNCEREQIHLAASIQPHGALLVARESDYVIVQASANAAAFLGLDGDVIGTPLRKIGGNLWERVRPHLGERIEAIPIVVRCHLNDPSKAHNALIHHCAGGGLIVELERAGEAIDFSQPIERAVQSVLSAATLQALCDDSARIFSDLTGYDRVMVYRFDDAGHGEVFSETKKPELEAFLGNRYPASDIPQIARRLYVRNRVRLLADIHYTPSALVPRLSPITGEDLDMSMCFLRSVSPIHVQYLKNMGVAGTLVVSLMVGGRLWGLVSCHHYSPRAVHFEMRAICELLAEVIGTRIAALESFSQGQGELSVRRLEQRMIESISRDGDWRGALFDSSQAILKLVGATGAALLLDDQVLTTGDVPGTQQLRELGQWLDQKKLHAAVRRSRGGRERTACRAGFEHAGRLPRVVSTRADPDGDVGREPVQALRRRQQPVRSVSAAFIRPMASARRGDCRGVVARGAGDRTPDRSDSQ